jgi:type I restriction enzyme S subunit
MKKAYPTYKESDLPWLSEMPSHWQPVMNRYLLRLKKTQVGEKSGDYTLLSLTLNGIIKRDVENPKGKFPAEFNTYQEVSSGDLVFCLFDIEETPRTIGLSLYEGMITGAYTVFECKENLLNQFAYYYYLFLDNKKSLRYYYRGLRNTVSKDNFNAIKIPLPPLPEQRQIVAYLDHKCALIDTFIAKKKRLIELLQEQKQAIINQAVTRGIDLDVPLKPSGVDWLGDIPAHWGKGKLKFYIDILPGYAFPSSQYSQDANDIKLLRGINVNPDRIIWEETVYWPQINAYDLDAYKLQEGDIVFGMDRPWIKSGMRVALITKDDLPALLLQRVARLRIKDGLSQEFLFCLLKSKAFIDYFSPQLTGISVPHISTGQIGEFVIALPSMQEQDAILQYITKEQYRIQMTIEKVVTELRLIEEYKTTLIAEAVTGKIDVRDWQAEKNADIPENLRTAIS